MKERIYYIPKNLNSEWLLLGCFTLPDITLLILTFFLAVAVSYGTRTITAFFPWCVLLVLRLRMDERTIARHLLTRLRFLLNRSSRTYLLFEREC